MKIKSKSKTNRPKKIDTDDILKILPQHNVSISDKNINDILHNYLDHYSNCLDTIEISKLKSAIRDKPLYTWGGRRAGRKNPMAKEFIFISPPPSCDIYYVVGEARKFCVEHNLSFNALYYQYRNRRVPPIPPVENGGGIKRVKGCNDQMIERRKNTTGWIMRF